jgi:hypothetical protein
MSEFIKGIGTLDYGEWLYGLIAASIQGGSGAVVAGFTASAMSKDFPVGGIKSFELMGAVFLVNGMLGAMAFLRQKPLPSIHTTTNTTVDTLGNLSQSTETTITAPLAQKDTKA